jgi:hypothetical protein
MKNFIVQLLHLMKYSIMQKLLFFGFLIPFQITFAQSKKEQIELLTKRVDSLNSVLSNERNSAAQKTTEFKSNVSQLQKELTKTESTLSQKEIELSNLKKDVFNKSKKIQELESQLLELNENLRRLAVENEKLKLTLNELSTNSNIELIASPTFSISTSELIKIVDRKMVEPCPQENVLGESGPGICKKQVTKVQYFKKGNVIRLFACVGYSYNGAHFDSGQDGFVLAEYRNSTWTIIDFLQFDHQGCWGESFEVENQFLLGKNSFGYFGETCGTAQGFTGCNSFIIGFVNDKIAVLLSELSSENNLGSGEKPVIDWKNTYRVLPSENEWYTVEKKVTRLNKAIATQLLMLNIKSMKFE